MKLVRTDALWLVWLEAENRGWAGTVRELVTPQGVGGSALLTLDVQPRTALLIEPNPDPCLQAGSDGLGTMPKSSLNCDRPAARWLLSPVN